MKHVDWTTVLCIALIAWWLLDDHSKRLCREECSRTRSALVCDDVCR